MSFVIRTALIGLIVFVAGAALATALNGLNAPSWTFLIGAAVICALACAALMLGSGARTREPSRGRPA